MPKLNKQEYLIVHLEKEILSRSLKPGDRLPSELELQEKFSVGRGTIREALRTLQQKGLIEIKKGAKGGVFVKEVDAEQVRDTLTTLMRHQRISPKHLYEFRLALEPAIAAHAAERATPEDIKRLKRLLSEGIQIAESKKRVFHDFYNWENNMHLELATICGNPIFEWILFAVGYDLEPYSKILNLQSTYIDVIDDWKTLIDAMEKGEVMKVVSIFTMHIGKFSRIRSKIENAKQANS